MIKQLLEEFEDYEFEELKAEIIELTNYNNHCEALISIANKYAPEFIDKFQKFIDLRDKNNGLSLEEVAERYDLSKEMFKKIVNILGQDKAQELYSCL